jgi:hypothetical protein
MPPSGGIAGPSDLGGSANGGESNDNFASPSENMK